VTNTVLKVFKHWVRESVCKRNKKQEEVRNDG
jgi:hypothetical protein